MNDTLLNIHEAASFLGRKHQAVRRLIHKGILPALLDGQAYFFRLTDLEKVKAQQYPEGMNHSDIAREYDVKRTTVVATFKRLRVQPIGNYRGRNNATVYTQTTVARFAQILGWDRRKNPTGELSHPARVSSGLDGEPSHDPPHADRGANSADSADHIPSSAGTPAR